MVDSGIKALTEDLPAPDFETTAFTTPPPLSEATVAIVTTASLHHPDQDDFASTDIGYRILDGSRRDYVTGHWSPNFDGAGFAYDMNTVFPLDRIDELAARGVIGRVADQHLAYAGNQFDLPPSGWTRHRRAPRGCANRASTSRCCSRGQTTAAIGPAR